MIRKLRIIIKLFNSINSKCIKNDFKRINLHNNVSQANEDNGDDENSGDINIQIPLIVVMKIFSNS